MKKLLLLVTFLFVTITHAQVLRRPIININVSPYFMDVRVFNDNDVLVRCSGWINLINTRTNRFFSVYYNDVTFAQSSSMRSYYFGQNAGYWTRFFSHQIYCY